MRVLVACERSGRVRDAFLALGHDAWSCDVMPGNGERHLQRDVTALLRERWDLVIAHPPCTYLTKLGAKCRSRDFGRRLKMLDAVEFFLQCWNANSDRVAVENPIMFLEARARIGVEPAQMICPSMFGHNVTKATYLWLRGLPKLVPTDQRVVELVGTPGKRGFVSRTLTKNRARDRSTTFQGIANAMAEQWGR